jgi:hypothetical protein
MPLQRKTVSAKEGTGREAPTMKMQLPKSEWSREWPLHCVIRKKWIENIKSQSMGRARM